MTYIVMALYSYGNYLAGLGAISGKDILQASHNYIVNYSYGLYSYGPI